MPPVDLYKCMCSQPNLESTRQTYMLAVYQNKDFFRVVLCNKHRKAKSSLKAVHAGDSVAKGLPTMSEALDLEGSQPS